MPADCVPDEAVANREDRTQTPEKNRTEVPGEGRPPVWVKRIPVPVWVLPASAVAFADVEWLGWSAEAAAGCCSPVHSFDGKSRLIEECNDCT